MLLIRDNEDSVRARASIILVSGSYSSRSLAIHECHEYIIKAFDGLVLTTCNNHLAIGHLTKPKVWSLSYSFTEQISDFLVVDLQVLHAHLDLGVLRRYKPMDGFENVADGAWNDAIHLLNLG